MILVMDIGNTNIKLGLFDKDDIVDSWRLTTSFTRTADEYATIIYELFSVSKRKFEDIEGIIISSVTPSVNYTIEHMCRYYFNIDPIMIIPGIKTGLNLKYDNTKELGADRIVNAVAAYKLYGGSCIVIDFGTATTFSVVSKSGEFLGGAICPGIKVSMDAMVNNTAKLPKIELIKPHNVINKNTVSNMQSGIINGFIGMVEYITKKMKKELQDDSIKVIATGGMSELIIGEEKIIDIKDRALTLKGLKIIYDLNQEDRKI